MREPTVVYRYSYRTRMGVVHLEPQEGGRYQVIFDNEALGSYHSAAAAADDVSGGHTFTPSCGVDFDELDVPADLAEWTRTPFAIVHPFRRV